MKSAPDWVSRTGSVGGSPEYTSGTSTFAGAGSKVLESFYCNADVSFCFETDGSSTGERCYDSPYQAAVEAGHSRILQGIHFDFSNVAGRVAGRGIGEEVTRERLKPIDGRHHGCACVAGEN